MRRAHLRAGVAAALIAAPVLAKLPPLSDEAKAKAAEAAAKTAWADKVGAYKACQAMNRAVDNYRQTAKAAARDTPAPIDTPPCTDPGPFAPPPLEAAGAHSPPTTATAPPSSKATAADIQGHTKK
jgi:hypothetical protein